MTSVQRKFAASLIALLLVSSTSYTGQTTKLKSDDCNKDGDLATQIQKCLTMKGVTFDKLCITANHIEVILNVDTAMPVDCKVINAIRECTLSAVGAEPVYEVTVLIRPSTPGAPPQLVYKGHTGTGTDPDAMPICIDVLALASKGTLNINFNAVEKIVTAEAKQLGVKLDKLRVGVEKCKDGKLCIKCKDGALCLQVSGKASASKISESRITGIVAALVSKYTGVIKINTDNLKVLSTTR
jgi:hypothetical protein